MVAKRAVRTSSLSNLALLEASAKRFSLLDSAANIETIRAGLNELNQAPAPEKRGKIEALQEDIIDTRLRLETEHAEMGIEKVDWRKHRGVIGGIVIFAIQAFNFVTIMLPTEFLRNVANLSSAAEKNIHMVAAPIIFALIAIPARDLIYAYRFEGLKSDIAKALGKIENELEKQLGKQ